MAAAPDYLIIDCDSHLTEDLDRLRELTNKKYRHLAPRMLDQGHGELFAWPANICRSRPACHGAKPRPPVHFT